MKLTSDLVAKIHDLYSQGLAKTDIGRRLGISRSSVSGALSREPWEYYKPPRRSEYSVIDLIEDRVRQSGPLSVERLASSFSATPSQIRNCVRRSICLECKGGIVFISPLVDSEFGRLPAREVEILRKNNEVTPHEIRERAREARLQSLVEKRGLLKYSTKG